MAETTQARASLPTVARTSDCMDALESFGEEATQDLVEQRFTWAVDLGDGLRAMTTFDLWYALNCGDLEAHVRVWRLGREAWSQACDVPELACALRAPSAKDDLAGRSKRTTLDYVAKPPSFGGTALASGIDAPCGLMKPASPLDALPATLLRGPFPRVSVEEVGESARRTQPHELFVARPAADPQLLTAPPPFIPDCGMPDALQATAVSYIPRVEPKRATRTKVAVGVAFAIASALATILIVLTGGSAIGSPSEAAALEASGTTSIEDAKRSKVDVCEAEAVTPACDPAPSLVEPRTVASPEASGQPGPELKKSRRPRSVSPTTQGQTRRRR